MFLFRRSRENHDVAVVAQIQFTLNINSGSGHPQKRSVPPPATHTATLFFRLAVLTFHVSFKLMYLIREGK
jgi:hypothetical protein